MKNIIQLLTDPENQPHQFVGDPDGLKALILQEKRPEPEYPDGADNHMDYVSYGSDMGWNACIDAMVSK